MSEMFDIKHNNVKGPIYNAPTRYYTEEEIQEKLINYIEVPKNMYDTIRPGSHVRYIKIDGVFRCGGFVTMNPIKSTKNEDSIEFFMRLRSDIRVKSANQVQWLVNYGNIDKLYVKVSVEHEMFKAEINSRLDHIVHMMNRNFEKVKKKIKDLESGDTVSVSAMSTRSSIHPICADIERGVVGSVKLTRETLNKISSNP